MDSGQLVQLEALKQLAARGELSNDDAAAWYELVMDVRKQTDYYERELIRHLKYACKMKWRQVAEVLGVTTRQAAFQRWRRMIGPRPGSGSHNRSAKSLQ
jgi:hypothetical protein